MTTLNITRGYPGSGKTTFARKWVTEETEPIGIRVRVNRDDLRANMFGILHGLTYEQERAVTTAQHAAVEQLLRTGHDVIVDDTHLRARHARAWADLAIRVGADLHVHDFTADADTCIDRDRRRDRVVGDRVIRDMAARFPQPWPTVKPSPRTAQTAPAAYTPDTTAPKAWLVDIDGTLALMGDRSPYDTERVGEDQPAELIVDLARTLRTTGVQLVIMSGRTEDARPATEEWLARHLGEYAELHMRASHDRRPDYLVKADLFDAHVRHRWNVLGVLDDRDQVVRMWRSIGLTCLQVADGDF